MSYRYLCKECGVQATKPPVEPHKENEPALATLGKWRCKVHGVTKVRRVKANE